MLNKMNIHQKINHRSQFCHIYNTSGCFSISNISLHKGYFGDISRPHKDLRYNSHRIFKILGYLPVSTKPYKFHSKYPKS